LCARPMPAGCLSRPEPLVDRPEPVGEPPRCEPVPVREPVDHVLQPGRRSQDEFASDSLRPGKVGRPGLPHPGADALEAVGARLQRVGRRVQRIPQVCLVVEVRHHASRSRTARNAVMALAVWLFTAPRLIPIASAI
jgi:hypothetical protein